MFNFYLKIYLNFKTALSGHQVKKLQIIFPKDKFLSITRVVVNPNYVNWLSSLIQRSNTQSDADKADALLKPGGFPKSQMPSRNAERHLQRHTVPKKTASTISPLPDIPPL